MSHDFITLDQPIIETTKRKRISITVEYVFKANFNDTYWLEKSDYNLEELDKENLTWIDPYNGRSKTNSTQIALAYCSDEKFVILKKESGIIKAEEDSVLCGSILCEDYNESMLLSARVDVR
jgi:hypothetical protein